MYRLVLMLTAVLVIIIPAQAQADLDTDAIDTTVNEMLAAYAVPGASFAVVQDGAIIYAQGYGVRSTETEEPVTPETQFSIGSVTKSVTALAIAQQVEAGTLDLDTPIVAYLPDFELSDPDATQQLTLRHLLANTGGFTPEDSAWYGGQITTLAEVPAYIGTLPVVAEPGTLNAYNNLGYALAGYVLQTVTGQSWADYVEEHIFQPLGLDAATTDFDAMQQGDNYSVPHLLDVREGVQPIPFFPYMGAIAPAGSVNMSVLELAEYARLHLSDGMGIVSPEMLTEMHTAILADYGLGWANGELGGYQTVWHNGSIDGFGALVTLVPAEGLGVVGLMNADYSDNAGFLDATVLRIVEIALGIDTGVIAEIQAQTGLDPAERAAVLEAARSYQADPAAFEPLTGSYGDLMGGEITVYTRDERLYLDIAYPELTQTFELIPYAPNQFIGNGRGLAGTPVEFVTEADGIVRLLQAGFEVGRKLGEGVEALRYADPANRFSVPVPAGWMLEEQADYALLTSAESGAVFALGATTASNDLQADAVAFAGQTGISVSGEPLAANAIPLPGGQVWTQYVWLVADGSVVAVNGYAQNGTAYFISLHGSENEIQPLLMPLNELLLGFSIGK